MKSILSIFLLSTLLFGCSSTGGMSAEEKNEAYRQYVSEKNIENVDKITSFRFHGWQSLTNDFLIISSTPRKKYLLEMSGYCVDLKFAHALIINRSTGSTLHAKFDSISTLENREMNCRIKSIYPITKEQSKEISALDDIDNDEVKLAEQEK